MEVYHYTSKNSLDRIQMSGRIRQSPLSNRDAFYGAGVYLTTLTPDEGRKKIASNNWGQNGPYMEKKGKVERAIKLRIPEGRLKRARSGERDIWVHTGDVVLSDYLYSIVHLDGSWSDWCTVM
ncbi:hypothetical protein ACOMHN_004717 [Nucella lapillus]